MQEDRLEPVIGQWYRDVDNRIFEVVASDDESIEIQFYDGDIEELEIEVWDELSVIAIEEPNDGSGPFDEVDDDIGLLAEDYHTGQWWT
ncbi:MAG: hypothetical protein PVG13_01475 [Thiohalophilus sp.]|jgi:hypothetical protein